MLLYQTLNVLINGNSSQTYHKVADLLQIVQTCALLEVVHAAIGIVKSGTLTTAMQVASRLYIVWAVLDVYPKVVFIKFRSQNQSS